ncbi:ABC transporter six-transmembrane domain-containing protein [Motilimonas eburnea]|uniref:ABC transporter six-transmembrane domain-containing protein n=1 Tax=Motilimonas eburnea TaxID=1737488 RepID=UPI001E4520E9|nr:ABC transporter six-transmembrane domain-containing protein [Motilimonas eburnea]
MFNQAISLPMVLALAPLKLTLTWLLVLIENVLLILLPLLIGKAIDGVLQQQMQPLLMFAALLLVLVGVSVARRFYDTRVYGAIRVRLAQRVARKLRAAPVSMTDARLTMSRELVDFFEHELPTLFTAVIQLVATVVILASFASQLAWSVLAAGLASLLVFALFHQQFKHLNGALNDQRECQVALLGRGSFRLLSEHFARLKRCEIKLSDTESIVYGLIFTLLFASVLANLWLVSTLSSPSAGQVFAIVTYSLEFVEAAVLLPMALQTLTRLQEITERLNQPTPLQALTHNS